VKISRHQVEEQVKIKSKLPKIVCGLLIKIHLLAGHMGQLPHRMFLGPDQAAPHQPVHQRQRNFRPCWPCGPATSSNVLWLQGEPDTTRYHASRQSGEIDANSWATGWRRGCIVCTIEVNSDPSVGVVMVSRFQ
jgi:hypothetical protein